MLLFLLLVSFSSVVYCYDVSREYGDTYKIIMSSQAKSLEFRPRDKSNVIILWNHTNPTLPESSSRKRIGIYFLMYNLTQADNGQYITRNKAGLELDTYNFYISENTKSYKRKTGSSLLLSFNLDPQSCNIYFFSESKMSRVKMVINGTLTGEVYYSGCSYIELDPPCRLQNTYIKSTCKGQFEFRDQNNNNALVVSLDVEPEELNLSPIGITLGVLSIVSGCCGCLKYCCCGGSSDKEEEEEEGSPENEPAVQFNENESQPIQFNSGVPPPDYSQPSYNETGPLMYNPPSVAIKSSENSASDQKAIHGPSSIISEPRFTLKGMSFPSLLNSGSGSTTHDVYTSDKLK